MDICRLSNKRIAAILLCALLLLAMLLVPLPAHASVTSLSGSGTAGDPLLISTVEELEFMRDQVNSGGTFSGTSYASAYYRLQNDLDLSGIANWVPIGTMANAFKGFFDGNGHVIRNMTITSATGTLAGFFGLASSSGNITAVGIVDCNIATSDASYTGPLAAYASGHETIDHCFSTGSVSSTNAGAIIGGLVGRLQASQIENCYSKADVDGLNYSGGIVGFVFDNTSTIINCFATGSVKGFYAGGIFAYCNDCLVRHCGALNESLVGSSVAGRIGSVSTGFYDTNYAWSDMTILPGMLIGPGVASRDGANASSADLADPTFWSTTLSFASSDWDFADGGLPTLKAITSEYETSYLPSHLADISLVISSANLNAGESFTATATATGLLSGKTINWTIPAGWAASGTSLVKTITVAGSTTTGTYSVRAVAQLGSTDYASAKSVAVTGATPTSLGSDSDAPSLPVIGLSDVNWSADPITIDIRTNPRVSTWIFSRLHSAYPDRKLKLIGNGYSLTFDGGNPVNDSGRLLYDFGAVFDGGDSLGAIRSLAGDALIKTVQFSHSGLLPGTAEVSLIVGTQYAGQTIAYSYYNPQSGQLEFVQNAVVDEQGNVTVRQDHCSAYALTKAAADDTEIPQTDDPACGWLVIALAAVLMAALVTASILRSRVARR